MQEVKEKLANALEAFDELTVDNLNVNRKFIRITYKSELENDDVEEKLKEILDDYELFGINFTTDSDDGSDDTRDVVSFRVR